MKNTLKSLIFISLFFTIACNKSEPSYDNVVKMVDKVSIEQSAITADEVHQMLSENPELVIIDIREPGEYSPGAIPGSINIPRGLLEFKIADAKFWKSKAKVSPNKEDEIVIICRKGHRSILAAKTLYLMGYKHVKYVKGGFKSWEINYPNEQIKSEESGNELWSEAGC